MKIIRNFLNKGRLLYHRIPACIRWILWPAKSVFTLVKILRLDIWLLRGETKINCDETGIILAAHSQEKNYFGKMAFNESYVETYLGKKWVWQILKIIEKRKKDYTLLIVAVPYILHRLTKKFNFFFVPCWISSEMDIPTTWPMPVKNKNSSLKSDISKIRKNRLDFEVTHEMSELHNFYYNMYIPYITTVHSDSSYFWDYDYVKSEFSRKGFFKDLLLVKKKEEYIAGILLCYKGDTVELSTLGVMNANMNYVRDGVIGALFYFSVMYAADKGFKKVTFGGSRSFLKDGVLRYKRKWNQKLIREKKPGFIIKALSQSEGLRRFMCDNPFIHEDKAGLKGAIFVPPEQTLSSDNLATIYRKYYFDGLTRLVVYRFGARKENQYNIPAKLSGKIEVSSAESMF